MPTHYKTDAEIKKEFYGKFVAGYHSPSTPDGPGEYDEVLESYPEDVWGFILSLRSSDRHALLDGIEGWIRKQRDWTINDYTCEKKSCGDPQCSAYHGALDDLSTFLKGLRDGNK